MYSIEPLSPERSAPFERLAPLAVRPLLTAHGALPHLVVVGASGEGMPAGLAMAVDYGGSPAEVAGVVSRGTARLLSIAVGRRHRRLGIGSRMLDTMLEALAARGASRVSATYRFDLPEAQATIEGFFKSRGWTDPALALLHCAAGVEMLESPLLKRERALPPEYEIVDWIDLSADDRARIAAHRGEPGWHQATLDPFLWERELETLNSLALRYRGEVVGWLLTRRTARTEMHYNCLFVREDLARLGRGANLMKAAIERHWTEIKPAAGVGRWATPATLPAMIAFIRRHLAPFSSGLSEQRVVSMTLPASSATPPIVASLPTRGAATVQRVTALSAEACADVAAAVLGLRPQWRSRRWVLPFHTLGAVSELDGDAAAHGPIVAKMNPVLLDRFGALYESLRTAMERILDGPVQYRSGAALPAFHIRRPVRGSNLPILPLRAWPPERDLRTFVLSIEIPRHGAAVNVWPLGYGDVVGLEMDEVARLVQATPAGRHEVRRGEVLLHACDLHHQFTPFAEVAPNEAWIYMEGRVAPSGAGWEIFG